MLFGTPNDSGTCGTGGTNCSLTDAGNAAVEYYGSSGILHATAQYNRIGVAVPIIFEDGTPGKFDGWNLYTGGFSLGSTPDFLFSEYHSQFASTACGGSFNDFPADYDFNCDPQFDAISNAVQPVYSKRQQRDSTTSHPLLECTVASNNSPS
jgi:hypothetical protein